MSDFREKILFKTISILKSNNIDYWITDGTLLGIIRENRILPWDGDLDIAIFKNENSMNDIVKLFESHGYKNIKMLPDMDCLHFKIDNFQVDIGFYTKKDEETSIKWATKPFSKFDNFFVTISAIIFDYKYQSLKIDYKQNFIKAVVKKIVGIFGNLLSNRVTNKLFSLAIKKYNYIGSTYPNNMMCFKEYIFKDNTIIIPKNEKEYLRLTYGDDWRVPNENYIWEKDTFNLQQIT